jgi:hypothetical protein
MLLIGESSSAGGSELVDVLNWLSPTQYDSRHKKIKHHWIKGTGIWLLETPHYKRWRFESDAPSFPRDREDGPQPFLSVITAVSTTTGST